MTHDAAVARYRRAFATTDVVYEPGDAQRRGADHRAAGSTARGSLALRQHQRGRVRALTTNDPRRSFTAGIRVALRKWISQAIPPAWVIPGSSVRSNEVTVANYGPVEIRVCPPGCAVETYVKGELDAARMTGLRRLTKYVTGDNWDTRQLATACPLEQQQQAPGRWLVRIRLATIEDAFSAPTPTMRKVRVCTLTPEHMAVIRIPARPSPQSLARGKEAIWAALNESGWVATGEAMVRMHGAVTMLPFMGGFEVAVPIARR